MVFVLKFTLIVNKGLYNFKFSWDFKYSEKLSCTVKHLSCLILTMDKMYQHFVCKWTMNFFVLILYSSSIDYTITSNLLF